MKPSIKRNMIRDIICDTIREPNKIDVLNG